MNILIFGSNGMLGKYMSIYLKEQSHNVTDITRKDFDIYQEYLKETLIDNIKKLLDGIQVVINCAGVTNKRPDLSISEMYIVNSYFPNILDDICNDLSITLIHPTTDCVFSGKKGDYTEKDFPDCHDDYGISKYLGERLKNACVFRVSIIGECSRDKSSLLEWVKSQKKINGYENHIWNGITCLEYAKMINEMILSRSLLDGLWHVKSENKISKHDLIKCFIKTYDLDIELNKITSNISCDRSLEAEIIRKPIEEQIMDLKLYTDKI